MTAYPDADFSSSRACFGELVSSLSGTETAALDHEEVERIINSDGLELMRRLMQDHLELRARREEESREPTRGSDGEVRPERRRSSRQLGTLFGDVEVRRLALFKRGVSGGLRPLDAELNLPVAKHSHGVAREVAWGVAQGSFESTVVNIRRTTGSTIGKRQAEELAVSLAVDFEDFYLERPQEPVGSGYLLVLSFDGSGVVMLPEALRSATRKRAERDTRRRTTAETAASVGQRPVRKNRKRMAEVAAVYELEAVPRSPDDILRSLDRSGPHKPRPKAKNKRVWASVERPVHDVVDEAFIEASMRDEALQRRWVAVVDGNKDQLARIHAMSRNLGVQVTIVLDFIHVLGYLWHAAKAIEGGDREATEAWVDERARRILRGESSGVAAGMRRAATHRELSGKAREAIDDCARYLLNNKQYLRYHEYLRDGLPIASGVIEGACRSLVKDRMDITGARWGLQGAEAVLKLRSLRASGDLDRYLEFHFEGELHRNHLENFHEDELVPLREAA